MGDDGKPVEKKYYANKVQGRGADGTQIGELHEMYQDGRDQKKVIAQERTMNGDGRRIVKTKRGNGPEQVFNYYNGIGE